MNHDRFDRLSQTLADTSLHSRRGVLAALAIAVLGTLVGVDSDAAGAKPKSRRHAKRKSRHESSPRQQDAQGRLHPTSSRLQPKPSTRCKFSRAGVPCQEAICTGETTLRPACACTKRGRCECPDEAACTNHLVCQNGACLTKCGDDLDCAKGTTCDADGSCTVALPGPSCNCSNLNYCSGNGNCTPECTCVCNEGWTGAACDELPPVNCSDHLTCAECTNDTRNGCVFCSTSVDGATGVCVTSDQCLLPQDGC